MMHPPCYVFLDIEWADLFATELVSLALVSDDGTRQFYAEVDPLPEAPTTFVKETVYPLLDRGLAALSHATLAESLEAFLAELPHPAFVLFDHANDGELFKRTLAMTNGFVKADPSQLVLTKMLRDRDFTRYLEGWFVANPAAQARRHHALVDAEALRQAWLAITGRITPTWEPVDRPP